MLNQAVNMETLTMIAHAHLPRRMALVEGKLTNVATDVAEIKEWSHVVSEHLTQREEHE